jgi:phosphoribosylanthranilate isomerase
MWVKVCGITQVRDAQLAFSLGYNAIGLNFFSKSRRFVSVSVAAAIGDSLRTESRAERSMDIVGVFVNSPVNEVAEIADDLGLTAVQFHGDEAVQDIVEFHRITPRVKIIRAMRVSASRIDECLAELDSLCGEVPLTACLLDAFVPGEFGGTGATIDLDVVSAYFTADRPRLILAGGLTASNVAGIVESAEPWGIDTASGVESSPGIKSDEKCQLFIEAARRGTGESAVRL